MSPILVGCPSSPVSYTKDEGFVTEASSIQWKGGPVLLKSAKTGVTRVFDMIHPVWVDGDLIQWDLGSVDGLLLTIFND